MDKIIEESVRRLIKTLEADQSPEDRKDTTDQTLNLATINMKVDRDPRDLEEISLLEEEDSGNLRANQDSSGVEVKMNETNRSKGGFHLWKKKWTK